MNNYGCSMSKRYGSTEVVPRAVPCTKKGGKAHNMLLDQETSYSA